ncbi:MAG: hypothetical protein AAF618_00775 [Pseudomonadota bacterium]
MSASTEGQLVFIGPEPEQRVILGPGRGTEPQLWYRHDGGWLRQEWAGQFRDGTPRPPWCNEQFFELWETEGPEAAHDTSRYDLSEQEAVLERARMSRPGGG